MQGATMNDKLQIMTMPFFGPTYSTLPLIAGGSILPMSLIPYREYAHEIKLQAGHISTTLYNPGFLSIIASYLNYFSWIISSILTLSYWAFCSQQLVFVYFYIFMVPFGL
ncbi:hypothetical protein GGR58DRAFT_103576 [Xylaria digitata]|nr:hypothetical protein GGR58DRAFT_103576 [Xylaria digitata]